MHMYPPTPANCNGERAGKEELLTTRTKGVFSSCWPFSKDFRQQHHHQQQREQEQKQEQRRQQVWSILLAYFVLWYVNKRLRIAHFSCTF